jgi:xanthine/uracil/vitamin C permease (AzgA family)
MDSRGGAPGLRFSFAAGIGLFLAFIGLNEAGIASAAAFALGVATLPPRWVSAPPSPAPILFKLDLSAMFGWGFFGVLLRIFVMALVDTMGTLVDVSERAGLLDEQGHLPQIERPMMVDALDHVRRPGRHHHRRRISSNQLPASALADARG